MPVKFRKRVFLRLLMGFCLLGALVLGYGYWHANTHASYYIDLRILTDSKNTTERWPGAAISFLAGDGSILASGVSDETANYVHLLHPEEGDCHDRVNAIGPGTPAGREAWQACFARLSTWIPQWADRVRMVDVFFRGKHFNKIPVTVSAYNSEWPLWWVPLPHIGGKPYTYYRTTITIEQTQASAVD